MGQPNQIPSIADLRAKQMEYALSGLQGAEGAILSLEFLIETWPRWAPHVELGPPVVRWINTISNTEGIREGGRAYAEWLKARTGEGDEQRGGIERSEDNARGAGR